ncbi:indolepyruvate ferredoxin oxidoreductase subunit alpha [Chloroflexota bacterium]
MVMTKELAPKKLTIGLDAPGERLVMLGNEAIARGAIEAGVQVAAAYPGTPSTEVVETLSRLAKEFDMHVEWSTNEKVAFEVSYGAALAGVRAMSCMKQVGLSVALDSVKGAAYNGIRGGLLLHSADETAARSPQGLRDTRLIAEREYIPVLEPATVQEAKDMTVEAFRLSEEFGHPFILRTVTTLSHGRSDVVLGKISGEKREGSFVKLPPAPWGRPAEVAVFKRFDKIKEAVNTFPWNQLKLVKGAKLGIIASGVAYVYVSEALRALKLDGKVSVLKIGTPYPLPETLVKKLLTSVDEVLVVEELNPFVELHVKAIAGEDNIPVKIHGKELIGPFEVSDRIVIGALSKVTGAASPIDFAELDRINKEMASLLPLRPYYACVGCPHRASQYALKRAAMKVAREYGKGVEPIYTPDIGCYSTGGNPPLGVSDRNATSSMGGSIGVACGLAQVMKAPVIAQIGDSTFFHAGMPPLVNAVFNKTKVTVVVLDNLTTGMTGFQAHPGTGTTAVGDETTAIKIEDVARAFGVKFIEIIDPFDSLKKAIDTFERAMRFDGPSVVVSRRICAQVYLSAMRRKGEAIIPYYVDQDKCTQCDVCITQFGCPAIIKEDEKVVIDSLQCTGCGVCAQVCPHNAIFQEQSK